MKIIISSDMGQDFAQYIKDVHISQWIGDNLDIEKLSPAQEYVDTTNEYKSIYTPRIDLSRLCLSCSSIIKIEDYNTYFELVFDNNAIVYGTLIKTVDIFNLINYGNIVVKPYPIFDYMQNYYNSNIEELFDNYSFGNGGF